MNSSLSKLVAAMLLLLAVSVAAPVVAQQGLPPAPPLMAPPQVVTPPGMLPPAAPVVKVAILLPLSGESVAIGSAMLDAAMMALSDNYLTTPSGDIRSQVILLPKDSGSTPAAAASAAQQAIDQGAAFIIGPLFSQSVALVAPIAKAHHVDILSFSNTRSVATPGIYTFGFLPEEQVERVAEYAYLRGYQRVAVLATNDAYGQKIRDTLMQSYHQKGGVVSPAELYAPNPINIDAAVARLANAYTSAKEEQRFQAIFIADGGYDLKHVIASLEKHQIDLKKIKLLGTGLWDDPAVDKIPEMAGAWYPSSAPGPYALFEKHFVATYGYTPVRLASLAYDAVTLVCNLTRPTSGGGLSDTALTNPAGFSGVNGLYRLMKDGTSQRKLDMMEVSAEGPKVIDVATPTFPTPEAPPSTGSAPAAPEASPATATGQPPAAPAP